MKKKSTSQLSKPSLKNPILLAMIALAVSASPGIGQGFDCPDKQATYWTYSGTGDWFTSSHWSNGVPVCNTNISYYAGIDNGYEAQISSGSASACEIVLGNTVTDSGSLTVNGSGSSLTTCRGIYVGNYGKGKLSITNGATVTTNGVGNIAWGTSTTKSIGTATVDGTSSTWTVAYEFDIGGTTNASGGIGLLTVSNGGTVTAPNAHVYGSGTLAGKGTFTMTSGGTTLEGTLAPSGGTLTIGGDLTFSVTPGNTPALECNVTPASADNVSVSGAAHLAGKISVTMTGTTFTAGSTYTLLHASGGLNSTSFGTVSIKGGSGDCFTPEITYDYPNKNVNLFLSPCQ